MRISGRKSVGGAAPVGGVQPRQPNEPPVEGATEAERATDVEISSTSREIAQAKESLAAMPDVRAERVSEIKPLVDDGSYNVESEVLARRVVDASLRESARERKASR